MSLSISGPSSINTLENPCGQYTVVVSGTTASSATWSTGSTGTTAGICFTRRADVYTTTISVTVTGANGARSTASRVITVD